MSRELKCATAAANILTQQGKVFLGYITAEREPYSAQQKPDISFIPDQGPNAGKVFFVELRFFDDGHLPSQYANALRDDKAFAVEGAEGDFGGFAFATNANLGRALIQRLAESGIHYLGPIDSAEMLAENICAWTSRSEERPVE